MNVLADKPVASIDAALVLERARIAGELHDNLSQSLHALSLQLDQALRDTSEDQLVESLRMAQQLACEAMAEARCTVWDLCPPSLETRGFAAAIEQVALRYRNIHWVDVRFESVGTPRPVSGRIGLALLRVCQEALSNAVRHAKARCIRVRVDFRPAHRGPSADQLVLTITDNGCGFSPVKAVTHGGGLRHMAARLAAVGATFDIDSRPGCGTVISSRLPQVTSNP